MRRAIQFIHPDELAELLAIVDGARAHRSGESDYRADAVLLLQLFDERRIRIALSKWKARSKAPSAKGCLTGDEVRAARARLNLSKRDLARRAGLHISTVTRFESGTGGASATSTAEALTAALAAEK